MLLLLLGLCVNCLCANTQALNDGVFEAIRKGDPQKVQSLLSQGLDVNCRNEKKMTPLIAAAKYDRFDIALLLCERGADVNVTSYINAADEDGCMSPLLWASSNGNIKMAQLFLQRKASINETSLFEFTPLVEAARKGHLPMVEFLVDNGANIDYSGSYTQNSALYMAVDNGHVNVVKYLIGKGANIHISDRFGNTLLIYGLYESLEMIKFLVGCGLDINVQNDSGETIFTILAGSPSQLERLSVWNYLLKHGANIQLKNSNGRSPLMEAARAGNARIAGLLLKNRAVINDTDNEGKTPLMFACMSGNAEVTMILLDHGAEINAQDKDGWTAIMEAAKKGDLKSVKLLAGRGADLNIKNNTGKSAIDIALQNKRTEIHNYLKSLITK